MRIIAAVMLTATGACSTPVVVSPLPPAPPADTASACALPEVEAIRTWRDTAVDHRLALVECGGAAAINYRAWVAIANDTRRAD